MLYIYMCVCVCIYNFVCLLVIFRLFTNLLLANLNKKCKNVYVIRTEKNNKITQKKDKNAIK